MISRDMGVVFSLSRHLSRKIDRESRERKVRPIGLLREFSGSLETTEKSRNQTVNSNRVQFHEFASVDALILKTSFIFLLLFIFSSLGISLFLYKYASPTMDFASLSKFNTVANSISGNFYPMTEERQRFGFFITVYMILVFLIKVVFVVTALHAWVHYVPILKIIENGGSASTNVIEVAIMSLYLNLRREQLRKLVREFNGILIDSGDLRRCLNDTVQPQQRSMKIYLICSCGAAVFWGAVPIIKIMNQDSFSYDDFILPAYLTDEPFDAKVFSCGVLIQTAAGFYLVFQKTSVDTYIGLFVATLTAEYNYIRQQMALAVRRDKNDEKDETTVVAALHKCVQHHCAVMKTGQMFIELFGIYVGVMYINSILRFCTCGFSFIAFGDDYIKKMIYLAYSLGVLIQVYVMCSCVQALLDASTSITDDAFHEDWHEHSRTIKNIFSTMELSNLMECRLTAFRVVDLTVPTLASILNQAYSACLLLQRMY